MTVIYKAKEQMQRLGEGANIKTKFLNEIFRYYCHELQIPPVKILNYFNNGYLKLINYSV